MNDVAINTTVDGLRNIFTIVLALSLGEAYKQVIVDRANDERLTAKPLYRDGLYAMCSFLLLLIPFYHGMFRYLDDAYKGQARPQAYGGFLLSDVVAFTVEASPFFVMSRALRRVHWRRFYYAVVMILVTDTVWGTAVWLSHYQQVLPWLKLNVGSLLVFIVILTLWSGPRF